MLREMSAEQFIEWQVFYSLEPFGEDREDLRFGSIVSTLMNINRNTKVRKQPFELRDGTLSGGDLFQEAPKPQKQSWQYMKTLALLMTAQSEAEYGRS